jgi:predicted transposase/invertase (TIGR01784 family)
MKFVNPTNDIAFKKIFGNSQKKEILISFLNAILAFEGSKMIKGINLVNPYQIPRIEALKETILDIKAINQEGEHFIIEMQKKYLGDFTKRSLYYTSKAYVEQLNKGFDYSTLNKVYFIGILNFDMFSGDNYVSRHLILNKETLMADIDGFEFTFLELNKFDKSLEKLDSILDKWMFFLKYAEDLSLIPPIFKNDTVFQQAFESAEQYRWDKNEIEIYDYIALKAFDDINAIKIAEKKGVLKVAEKLLLANIAIEVIISATGLSKQDIEKLERTNNHSKSS